MKILRVIGSADPNYGGPIEGLIRSSYELSRLGHQSEIVTLDSPDSQFLAEIPFKVHALGRVTRIYDYSPSLLKWLRANAPRFDFVIQHGLWNYTAFATWKALSRSKTPYFVFTHGMLDPWFRRTYPLKHLVKQLFWWFSEGRLLSDARGVLFTTEEERVLAHGQFWPWQMKEYVVGYGTADVAGEKKAQINKFRALVPALSGRQYLLFLSRIHPKKGCDILIRAFAKIASSIPNIDLVIAGPDQIGLRDMLENIARAEGIEKRIHWVGMIKGDEKWGAYRGANAFLLPSHSENFGIVVAEALSCKLPVLITNKVNIWREVESGGAGLVCDDNTEAYAQELKRFLALSDVEKKEMGERSRLVFKKNFEIGSTTKTLLETLTRLG